MNISKAEITLAEFDESHYDLKGKLKRKLILKDGCMYVAAINKKVAEDKFKKMIIKAVNGK